MLGLCQVSFLGLEHSTLGGVSYPHQGEQVFMTFCSVLWHLVCDPVAQIIPMAECRLLSSV